MEDKIYQESKWDYIEQNGWVMFVEQTMQEHKMVHEPYYYNFTTREITFNAPSFFQQPSSWPPTTFTIDRQTIFNPFDSKHFTKSEHPGLQPNDTKSVTFSDQVEDQENAWI